MMDFEKRCDVAVIGGGIAGVAAALAAAEKGAKTILIEKLIVPGGLATSGLVYIYLPLCDGMGKQVTFGIAERLLRNSITLGPGEIPDWHNGSGKRFLCHFSPASFMLSMEKLLVDAGVDIWYDTVVSDVSIEDNRMTSVTAVNESGTGRIYANCFVDASGSCITARRGNLKYFNGTNFNTVWAMEFNQKLTDSPWGSKLGCFFFISHDMAGENEPRLTAEERERLYPGMSDKEFLEISRSDGISGKLVSDFTLESHRILFERYKGGDRKNFFPVKLPVMPQFRKICCISGRTVLNTGDHLKTFDDSIGLAGDWRTADKVWEIPFGSMLPSEDIDGIIYAGRCTSSLDDAWEATRVIPAAAMTGEVAGTAAAMAVNRSVPSYKLPLEDLKKELAAGGFVFHRKDIDR